MTVPNPGRWLYGPSWPHPDMRMITSFGLSASRTSGPRPIFSSTPGRKLSTKTCAVGTSALMRSDAPRVPEIEAQALLVPRVDFPVGADPLGLPGAQRVALGRLDLDHLGAEIARGSACRGCRRTAATGRGCGRRPACRARPDDNLAGEVSRRPSQRPLRSGGIVLLGERDDRPSADEERLVDHLPVDQEGAHALGRGFVGSRQDAPRPFHLGRARHEAFVGDRNLRGVNAALAREAEISRRLAFGAEAVRFRHGREGAVVGGHPRLRRGETDRHADMVHGIGIGAVDAERLEQVGVADLKPDDPRTGGRDVGSHPQPLGRLDIGEDPDRAPDARPPSPGDREPPRPRAPRRRSPPWEG